MNARLKQFLLLVLIAAFLAGSSLLQKSLDHDRATLGLTISEPLEDAPPVLALTTQALGGFRGLISNFLWMRADTLQMNDQYFEAAQLANWITDLEPHYSQVWAYEGWNMAWNISVKFKDFNDRWRWITNGMVLLRDRGLQYNPDNTILYQQLAWIYQNKMGEYLDDANNYYKQQWAHEMQPFFGPNGTNFDALTHPQTAEDRTNAYVLIHTYKIDPVFAAQVNQEWGPLDWRLPEAHAIYWATLGLQQAQLHPAKVNPSDLMQLRRVIYQSMMQAFQHGQIIPNPFTGRALLGPNIDIIPKTDYAYLAMMKEDPSEAPHMSIGHRNFILDAVYYLYENNRLADARKWYQYLGERYPEKPILEFKPDSLPRNVPLDEYVVARVQGDVTDTSPDTATASIQGLLLQAYANLAMGQEDRYAGFRLLARKVYDVYMSKIDKYGADLSRVGLAPFPVLNHNVLAKLLDPKNGLPYDARAVIRSELRIPGDVNQPYGATSTNSVPLGTPSSSVTNAPSGTTAGE
jgi:hypothetical protein